MVFPFAPFALCALRYALNPRELGVSAVNFSSGCGESRSSNSLFNALCLSLGCSELLRRCLPTNSFPYRRPGDEKGWQPAPAALLKSASSSLASTCLSIHPATESLTEDVFRNRNT
jgi:hypothetical protein